MMQGNPFCLLKNYRLHILQSSTSIVVLDDIVITEKERLWSVNQNKAKLENLVHLKIKFQTKDDLPLPLSIPDLENNQQIKYSLQITMNALFPDIKQNQHIHGELINFDGTDRVELTPTVFLRDTFTCNILLINNLV